jgi:hypothetical protein
MAASPISGDDVQRTLILATCLGATVLALYSCSMHAAVTTDEQGNVVKVSSVRLESSLSRVAVAMLVAGGQLALELRWIRGFGADGSSGLGG